MRPENTLPRTVFGLVTDRPFSADVELRMDHRYFRGFMARDRYGRQRSEMIFAPGVSSVTVEDPVRHRQYVLLMNFGSRQVIEQDIPGKQQIWTEDIEQVSSSETRLIEGIRCYREHRTSAEGDSITDWICTRVGLVLEEIVAEDGATSSWALHNIRLEEPDPKLFEVPSAGDGTQPEQRTRP